MQGKPRQGPGHRHMDCDLYERCLDLAAKKDWRSFNCEACTYRGQHQGKDSVTTEKKENTRICEKCQEKPTLSPGCPLCSSCMAKKANAARAAKKANAARAAKKETKAKKPQSSSSQKRATESQGDAPKSKKTTRSIQKSTEVISGPSTDTLTINFGHYTHIHQQIEKLAEQEMRPVDLQVIYILKKYLEGGTEAGSIEHG